MAEKTDMREAALDTLMDMEKSGKLSHVAIGETLMRCQYAPKQERAFFTRLCEGVVEKRIYLDYILDQYSKVKMRKCKPLIRNLLRLSAYQILCMNVRDAAACSEAVMIAKKRGFRNLSGFVNGVLRTVARQKDSLLLPDRQKEEKTYLSVVYSMPLWITELLCEQYGVETAERILSSFQEVRPLTVRTNTAKISPDRLRELLLQEKVDVEEAVYFPFAFRISGFNYLKRVSSFQKGYFAVQDESSMFPVEMADIRPGDLVIDVCAAPGGKTFHAADRTGERGRVIARDLTEYKTEFIKENNDRIGYNHIKIEEWDAREPDENLFGKADVVLADLPCSGLGIMGRKNDIKYHISREQLTELQTLQREILSAVWKYVKPGGCLIYSTCTLNQAENEENVHWLMENTPLFPVSIEERLPKRLKGRTGEKGYLQLVPGKDHVDGFFVSKFMRGK